MSLWSLPRPGLSRWLFAIVALAMLTACGGDDDDTGGSPSGSPTDAAETAASDSGDSEGEPSPSAEEDGETAGSTLTEEDEEIIAQLEAHTIPEDLADGTTLGSPEAPLTMVMYEDFQCPFCLRYSARMEPTIVEEYVATGRVQLEFRQFPILGPESVQAATAAECAAGQGRFWQYQNRLFLVQARAGQWSDEQINVGRFSIENLQQAATDVGGIDRAAFDACLASPEALATVEADIDEARQAGIQGTPGFTFNGQPLGGSPATIDDWRLLLESLLAEVEEES